MRRKNILDYSLHNFFLQFVNNSSLLLCKFNVRSLFQIVDFFTFLSHYELFKIVTEFHREYISKPFLISSSLIHNRVEYEIKISDESEIRSLATD